MQRRAGVPAFRDCVITTPRQSGKSTLVLTLALWTMLAAPDRRVVYAAQSRVSARQKLLRTWWPQVARSPLGDRFTVFRANGSEALRCVNGSELVLVSSQEDSGHGESADLVVLDECWSYPDDRLELACRPMLATRPAGQMWLLTTAGTARSAWWWGKLDAARTSAQLGMPTGTCLVEYSAADDDDVLDEAVWRRVMPALGRTISVSTVRSDLAAMGIDQFKRSYLNMKPSVDDEGWQYIPRDVWEAARLD